MKGYKAFNKDMTCRGMQYAIGGEYTMDGEIKPCERGFHFCASLADCYRFYDMSEDTIICEVDALGTVITDDDIKFVTDHIKIGKKVKDPRTKSNTSKSSSGYCNNGDRNSGNCNSGDCNSGNCNSGNCNSGDWNSGDWNSGVFNTEKQPTIKLFDTESDWTMDDWYNSEAYVVMRCCPCTYSDFVTAERMSDEEKTNHPEYKTVGGYVKVFVATDEDKQNWWDALSDKDRQAVFDLPNFDADKFKMCTGIQV